MTCLTPASVLPKSEELQDLVRYREGVEMLMKLASDKSISNSEPAHAAILFEIFFKYASDHVRIFCNKLSRAVFNDSALVREAGWALKRGVKVSVMVQQEHVEESAFLELLTKGKVPVLRASEPAKLSTYNFAVMDDRSVRLEIDRTKCEAQARMHTPDLATALARRFDLWALPNASTPEQVALA
jgi:hypothetical protein